MASKKLQQLNANQGEEMKVDMSPMIDMVFLLLIFFVVNSRIIIASHDDRVDVPIAKNSDKPETQNGRITINILDDGTMIAESGEELADSVEVEKYIRQRRTEEESKGYGREIAISLRGDKDAVFRYSRIIMRAAGNSGVHQFKFSSLPVSQ